jgi:hypothetical protein
MSESRIYAVTPIDAMATPEPRLVEAISQGQALRHVTRGMFKVEAVSAKAAVDAMRSGIEVEQAGVVDSEGGHTD